MTIFRKIAGAKKQSVYDLIKQKNTRTGDDAEYEKNLVSFTEREYVACFPDIKVKVDNARFLNGKMPFCGEQFLRDYGDGADLRTSFNQKKSDPSSGLDYLDRQDLRHLKGEPISILKNVNDKDEVKRVFDKVKDKYYPLTSDYNTNTCDNENCTTCPRKEQMI